MTIKLNDFAGGSGGGLTMPFSVIRQTSLTLKEDASSLPLANNSDFYSALEFNNSQFGFDAATLQLAAVSTEQEIVNLSGQSGVLTNVISGLDTTANDITIRVTADGELFTFTANPFTLFGVVVVGDVLTYRGSNGVTQANVYGNGFDSGFSVTPGDHAKLILTPVQVVMRGLHGIPFKDSLIVTTQSANATAGGGGSKACALWALQTPIGL